MPHFRRHASIGQIGLKAVTPAVGCQLACLGSSLGCMEITSPPSTPSLDNTSKRALGHSGFYTLHFCLIMPLWQFEPLLTVISFSFVDV